MAVERVVVVDESDQVIGQKPRTDITHEDIYRIAALWLTNSKGQVLMAQRAFIKKNYPGLWGSAAAGTLEVGETYESNIYKEAEEEIGLTGVKFTQGPKFYFDSGQRRCFAQCYLVTLDREIASYTLQEDEVERLQWFDPTELTEDIRRHPDKYLPSAVKWPGLLLP